MSHDTRHRSSGYPCPGCGCGSPFYHSGLGLEIKRRDQHNGIMSTPDGVFLEISPGGTNTWDDSGIMYALYEVDNRDAAFQRAVAHGASPLCPPEPYAGQDAVFVRAPSGEAIGFCDCGAGQPDRTGRVKNFLQAGLTVPDVNACARFYIELGVEPTPCYNGSRTLALPDGRTLCLIPGGDLAGDPKAYSHISLLTDNIDKDLVRAVQLGGKIGHEPYDWSNLRIAFASGLGGEVIEFFCFYQDGREPDIFKVPPVPLNAPHTQPGKQIMQGGHHD